MGLSYPCGRQDDPPAANVKAVCVLAGPSTKADPDAGADYRRVILEAGGTRDGDDLIREFLGREPNNAAFLRDIGLEV